MAATAQLGAKWQLIWCHKHCYKLPQRQMLNNTVQSLGGTMLCFKNPYKLLAWFTRQSQKADGPSVPWVLFTDDVVAERIMSTPPVVLKSPVAVVLLSVDVCSAQKICTRLWYQGLIASRDMISVHQDFASVMKKLKKQHPWPSTEPLVLKFHRGRVHITLLAQSPSFLKGAP